MMLQISKMFLCSGSALAAAALMADELPQVPTMEYLGSINGKVSTILAVDGETRNLTFQRKGEHEDDSAWTTVLFPASRKTDDGSGREYWRVADFVGGETLRVANTNAAGEHAGWLLLGTVTNHVRHVGSVIGPKSSGYMTNLVEGLVASYRECSPSASYAASSNVWMGLNLNSPMEIGRIRIVPRQSSLGKQRLVGDVFEIADDAEFTNPVRIGGPIPDAALGGVWEFRLSQPVTSQYVRVKHMYKANAYLTIAELEVGPAGLKSPIGFSVSPSDITNMYAEVTWSVPAADHCVTAVVERAYSPAGPFTAISEWSDAMAGGTCRDMTAAIGVPCYYRVRTWAEGGLARFVCSDPVRYVRSRQLERDPTNLSVLRSGVSVLKAFAHITGITSTAGKGSESKAFDGDLNTYAETTCYTNDIETGDSIRYCNPAIGIDLGEGAAFHIVASFAFPRMDTAATSNLNRPRNMAIFGANESDISDRKLLSDLLGGFPPYTGQFNLTTNSVDTFRYVFFMSPTDYWTYGNVAEACFFGYTDQDVIDSGVLIPPPTVACATNELGVALSWEKAWNAESLRVERRRAGTDGAWTEVAMLAANELSFADVTVPRTGTWEWRITAVSGGETISSLPCSCYVKAARGFVIKFL